MHHLFRGQVSVFPALSRIITATTFCVLTWRGVVFRDQRQFEHETAGRLEY
jgi:hypothetical protein